MGLFRNVFGGPVMLFSAEVLRQLGGYEAQPTGYDHWWAPATRHLALRLLRNGTLRPYVPEWPPPPCRTHAVGSIIAADKCCTVNVLIWAHDNIQGIPGVDPRCW